MSIIFEVVDTILSEPTQRPGSRKGRPNHSPEFRRRLAMAACESGVSVARLARENGLNANLVYTWRRRYLAEQQAEAVQLVPVAIVNEVSSVNEPPALSESEVVRPAGSIEVRIGRAVVKVDGIVDAEMLRTVLGSLRS
ncbi:transposase [Paraburkholderia sp. BL6669N2]|uniref:IS66-like element accessory protein TnpA n=1 Tax=unclassified Paraburkholderia TaxID=2615204 RepID=UPI000E276489|nr:transposase [Paraburkholderia sp. BL6669N2]REG52232.1 transposase [Paraburkholderia sp. BL6669N2]